MNEIQIKIGAIFSQNIHNTDICHNMAIDFIKVD